MTDIHAGIDGWLFLTGGTNDVLSLYTNEAEFPPETAEEWARALIERDDLARSVGADYLHIIAPEKLPIYRHKSLLQLPADLQSPTLKVKSLLKHAGLPLSLLSLTSALSKMAQHRQVYMKTDTHWTYEGICFVYRLICQRLGIVPQIRTTGRNITHYRSTFDLGEKLSPAVEEDTLHLPFLPGIERVYANRIAELWDHAAATNTPVRIHNSLHVIYSNSRAESVKKKVMLFDDSFTDFRPTTLASLFIEQFQETHFVWTTNLDQDYVRQIKPDLIVTENAERFMRSAPSNRYNVEQDAARRLRSLD